MENNKKCLKFKEMIMEKTDGEADLVTLSQVSKHLIECANCRNYEKSLINMAKLTSLMKVEAPLYLETRVMAVINSEKTTKAHNYKALLTFGLSFTVVFIFAFTLLYNKSSVVVSKEVAVAKPAVVVAKIEPIKVIKSVKIVKKPVIALKQEKEVLPVIAKLIEVATEIPVEKGPEKAVVPLIINIPNNTVASAETNSNYGVSAVENRSNISSASGGKVTPVPTEPGMTLLDTEKAVVANNLINPNRNEAARIIVKVEETSLVKIIIYDKSVRPVAKILNEEKTPGNYEAYWYAKNDSEQTVSAGLYFVYIQIGKRVIKKNIMVVKQ